MRLIRVAPRLRIPDISLLDRRSTRVVPWHFLFGQVIPLQIPKFRVRQSLEIFLVEKKFVVLVHNLNIIESREFYCQVLVENLYFPKIELQMHRQLLLSLRSISVLVFLSLFRLLGSSRWSYLILLLSLFQIMEYKFFKYFILFFRITEFFCH